MARPAPSGTPALIAARLVIRYAKRGRMRFASHRDVARAIERGVRKAGVPVAYSAGFSPHPRISYSGGAPTGSASEAEYLEISLTRRCEPSGLGRQLDAALPDGIDVVDVVEVDGKSTALRLEASHWEVLMPGVPVDAARRAVEAFLASPSMLVSRLTTKGSRQLDARAAVLRLDVDRHVGADAVPGCAILRMVVQHLTPAVRPDDIMTALAQFLALAPGSPPVVTRLWQGPAEVAGQVGMPRVSPADAADSARSGDAARSAGVTAARPVGQPQPEGFIPASQIAAMRPVSAVGPVPAPAAAHELAEIQATRLPVGSADPAPAAQARANEQLLRGERAQLADSRAREPSGRDCPNARNGATEPTARSQ